LLDRPVGPGQPTSAALQMHDGGIEGHRRLAEATRDLRRSHAIYGGLHWIAVFDILEAAGLEVYLVNARDTKNLPGRKSDVQESQNG